MEYLVDSGHQRHDEHVVFGVISTKAEFATPSVSFSLDSGQSRSGTRLNSQYAVGSNSGMVVTCDNECIISRSLSAVDLLEEMMHVPELHRGIFARV